MDRDINRDALSQHGRTLNGCNQRGGRMLSLVDLVDAGSVDIHLAGYLAAMMQKGVSLLVGAKPGGAGKTAVMCACLNFIPTTMKMIVMDGAIDSAQAESVKDANRLCYLAHEIGAGSYYAYVWGQQARDFFALIRMGHAIASNLHADTIEQTYAQLCVQNGIPRDLVESVALKIYLRMSRTNKGGLHRWISHVYENDGVQDNLIWTGHADGSFHRIHESSYIEQSVEESWRNFLLMCQQHNIRKIEDVRLTLAS